MLTSMSRLGTTLTLTGMPVVNLDQSLRFRASINFFVGTPQYQQGKKAAVAVKRYHVSSPTLTTHGWKKSRGTIGVNSRDGESGEERRKNAVSRTATVTEQGSEILLSIFNKTRIDNFYSLTDNAHKVCNATRNPIYTHTTGQCQY